MTINIRMHGSAAEEELRSLYEWFLQDSELRENAGLKLVARDPEKGEMGTAIDVISLVTASAVGLPPMIEALRNWRSTRRIKPQITIERGDFKATFIDTDPEAVIEILESVAGDDGTP